MQSPTVLIIEDERSVTKALEMKMKSCGYNAIRSADGRDAITQLEEQHFSLVLCDSIMPSKDEFGAMCFMQEENVTTPIVVTANSGNMEKTSGLDAIDFFVKSDRLLDEISDRIIEHIRIPKTPQSYIS